MLLKVISHYDLNVLSMSVTGFKKMELYAVVFFEFFNFARPLNFNEHKLFLSITF